MSTTTYRDGFGNTWQDYRGQLRWTHRTDGTPVRTLILRDHDEVDAGFGGLTRTNTTGDNQ